MGGHSQIDDDPIVILSQHIAKQGLRMTRQRRLIAEVLLASEGHLNIEELHSIVRQRDANIGYATIYRTLKLLTECGLAVAANFGDGPARFESGLHRGHHDHMICTECGKIIEFNHPLIEKFQEEVASRNGFTITSHKLDMFGLCSECR